MVRTGKDDIMYLKGVVSFGTQECGKGYPGVYTNVKHYIPWIKRNMKEAETPTTETETGTDA